MAFCTKCGASSNPLNPDQTIFECPKCRLRFHIHGVEVADVVFDPHPLGYGPQLLKTIERAKEEAHLQGYDQ
jgi:hypothetical protein